MIYKFLPLEEVRRRYSTMLILVGVLLASCAPSSRYYQSKDSAPEYIPQYVTKKDAIPKYEPYAPANLKPYTIRGIRYQPLTTGRGFSDTGQASWYGQKFHGHKTSNGDIYDMYQMSAAHKTLPLPSYARITNLANGKQVVVRINDRGPFHINRIVDLSYAAALKLDMLKTGVANVKLDVIHVNETGQITVGKQPIIQQLGSGTYIQVIALKNLEKLKQIGDKLSTKLKVPNNIYSDQNIHKLRIGPISPLTNITTLLSQIKRLGYLEAFTIQIN